MFSILFDISVSNTFEGYYVRLYMLKKPLHNTPQNVPQTTCYIVYFQYFEELLSTLTINSYAIVAA